MFICLKNIPIFYFVCLTKYCLCDESGNFKSNFENIEVKLESGIVLGKVEKTVFKKQDYYAFRGIPFAAAPVGELRFKPPMAHPGWTKALEAYDNKPTCIQFSARMRNNEPFGISGSEDCLFISIYTPNLTGTAPVVIFDYNDSFRTGFNGTDTYSPDYFMEENVIVVTINNRLSVFGYLTTEDEIIPGNNGLRDFIFGLEWVQKNIKTFGGDPNRVTLMGSLSGGAVVNMMLYSEKAKGLFSGAIIQSGTAFDTSIFFEDSRSKAFEVGEQFNIKTNDSVELLTELQKADAEELLQKIIPVMGNDNSNRKKQTSTDMFTPVIEKYHPDAVLTDLPENSDIVNDVPILIGFNSREGLDFTSHFIFDPRLLVKNTELTLLRFPIRTGYRFEEDTASFKKANKEMLNFYFKGKGINDRSILEYALYAGDWMMGYPLNYAAKMLSSASKSPVFYYMFDFRGQLNENSQYLTRRSAINLKHWGASVGDELCYLFVCVRIHRDYVQLNKMVSEQAERKVLKKMVRLWTNFAKTGNPTPGPDKVLNNFTWQPIDKNNNNLAYAHITKTLRMSTNPLGERGTFWDQFLAKYKELAVDGVVFAGGDEDLEEITSPEEESEEEMGDDSFFKDELEYLEDNSIDNEENGVKTGTVLFVDAADELWAEDSIQKEESNREEL